MIFVKHIASGKWLKFKYHVGRSKGTDRDPGNIIAFSYIGVDHWTQARCFHSVSSAKTAIQRKPWEDGVYKFYQPFGAKLKEVKE